MLLSRLQYLPGALALALALVAAVASATITPSNTSTVNSRYFTGTLPLQGPGDGQQIAELVPQTREGAQRSIEGNLYRTNSSTVGNISDGEIAYISCNPADYPGFVDAQGLFNQAYENGNANISGVILYSTVTDYCDYQDDNNSMNGFPVLSMTNKTDSASLLDQIDDLAVHMKFFVQVHGRGSSDGNNGSGFQQNPLGPSPSTAVAMIILYSITGIITALFLVIILTGAIRAHRHPERYGPRNVLGRPRQSRAKGLGRAILDTIPIIKFGEKEPAKPTDVELGSSSEARNVEDVNSTGAVAVESPKTATTTTTTTTTTEALTKDATPPTTASSANQPATVEQTEGIAAAVAPSAAAATDATTPNDENLGCSICTEDFEKGQDIRVLPCDHKFHPDCVDPWLLNVSGTCPLCRVDLRPTKTNESSASHGDELAPPLNPEAESSSHRRAGLRDILFFRSHPDAPAEDRISALRRLREQRRNQSGEIAEHNSNANTSAEDVSRGDRRSRRISTRLSDVFSGRTRRGASPSQPGGSGANAA